MNSNREIYEIGELVNVTQGLAINAKTKHLFREKGLPLLRITDLFNNSYSQFISEKDVPKQCIATEEEIIYTRTGQVGFVFTNKKGVVHNNCFKVTPKDSRVRRRFLYWYLLQNSVYEYVNTVASGSAQKDLNHSAFKALKIPVPSLKEQDEINAILQPIDDRITLLRETNATLEAISQALFKSWFVDFDPVRAKVEGCTFEGLDVGTAALFPNGFEESELGLTPKGWGIKRLSDVLQARNERVEQLIVPEYASTNDGLVPREKIYKKQLAASSAKNKLIKRGDLVFGLSRQVLNFGQMQDDIGSVSSAYKVYQVKAEYVIPELLGRLIRTRSEYFFNAVSASSREGQSVSSDALGVLSFVQPPMRFQWMLWTIMQPLLERGKTCLQQAELLCEIRDTLLPGLISGAIPLSKAVGCLEESLAA